MKVLCSIEESLYRPEAVRWRERMKLLKPLGEVVVVLPCSMKKPYSFSRSHKIFMRATRGFQELILTSPFGICPREMENTYPISSYDVSTTGTWTCEEISAVGEVLSYYVGELDVVAHVDGGYRTVCEEHLENCIFTGTGDRLTSNESMKRLKSRLKDYNRLDHRDRMLHRLRSIAVYQFGEAGHYLIPEECRVTGRYHKKVLSSDGNEICTLMMDRGLYSLGLEGGSIIASGNSKWVNIDFKLETNTLFAPGVVDADRSIVPGDEVVIIRDEEVLGVGKAVLNGEEMVKASRGVAVKIRRRKRF